jgi:hypothetical protein
LSGLAQDCGCFWHRTCCIVLFSSAASKLSNVK